MGNKLGSSIYIFTIACGPFFESILWVPGLLRVNTLTLRTCPCFWIHCGYLMFGKSHFHKNKCHQIQSGVFSELKFSWGSLSVKVTPTSGLACLLALALVLALSLALPLSLLAQVLAHALLLTPTVLMMSLLFFFGR